jgi:hypothetical protein
MSTTTTESSSPAISPPPPLPVPWAENAEVKQYTGGCHCKKVLFEFEHPDIYTMPAINCNCSICDDRGYLNVSVYLCICRYSDRRSHHPLPDSLQQASSRLAKERTASRRTHLETAKLSTVFVRLAEPQLARRRQCSSSSSTCGPSTILTGAKSH